MTLDNESAEELGRILRQAREALSGADRPVNAPGMTAMRWSIIGILASLYVREHDESQSGLPFEIVGLQLAAVCLSFALEHPEEARALLGFAMGQQDEEGRGELVAASEALLDGASTDAGFNVRFFAAWERWMEHYEEWKRAAER